MATKSTSFNESNINIGSNTSSLTINIYFSAQNTQTFFYGKTLYCSCDGQTQSATVSHEKGGSVSASFTFNNIPHENDGSRTVSWSWSCSTGTSALGTISDSGNKTLTTIPRASKPSIKTYPNNTPDFNIGDTITIHMNRKAAFTHKVYFKYGNTNYLIAENVTDYCKFDTNLVADNLYSLIPNSTYYSNVIIVQTYNGSTLIGTDSCNYKAHVIDANPTFSNFDFEDINSKTVALTGNSKYNINGFSNIKVKISTSNKALPKKGASISKYRFIIGDKTTDINYSQTNEVSAVINNSPLGTYNVYAIDSRDNSTLVTKLATKVIQYTPISFNTSSCFVKRNNNGVGANAILTLSGNIWNDNFGKKTNSIKSVSYKYKKTTDTKWIPGPTTITPTLSGNTFSFNGQIGSTASDFTFDIQSSYDFIISISDELSTKEIQLTPMSSAIPNISLADIGVGIMCDYDENLGGLLQIGGKKFNEYPINWLKYRNYKTSVTVGANEIINKTIGSLDTPNGYSFLGILSKKNGYADQWVVSYSEYSGNIVAMIHSKYSQSITSYLECVVLFIKNEYIEQFRLT